MDGFKQFITSAKVVSEKKIPHYINWIKRFLDYQGRSPDGKVRNSDIDHFLNALQKRFEGWQVVQAEEAIRLYAYYWNQRKHKPTSRNIDADVLWKQYAKEMKTVLRLKHMAYSTEKSYLGWMRSFYAFLNGFHVNIRALQELMGHADVKTTEIYTHVMKKDIDGLKSPFDLL